MDISKEIHYAMRSAVRDSPHLWHQIARLRRNEHLSTEDASAMQDHFLYNTLQGAIRRLPFYEHISPRFSVKDARKVLTEEFPVIDKSTLLSNSKLLYPHGGKRRPWEPVGMTSGTTGTPLVVYRSLNSTLVEQAFIKRQWVWAGYRRGNARVTLRGDLVVPTSRDDPPFWFWNRYDKQLLVSSRHLKDDYAEAIIGEIVRLKPFALQAYPSTAYTLAQLLQQRGQRLSIPYLFSASEPLYDHQRSSIYEQLGSTVMDMYGMAERVAFATDCEHGNLHVNSDYSCVEILDHNGNPTSDEGYIVGTTFHNAAMPLVRYRLSDRTRWSSRPCPCGRVFPTIDPVTGKYEDMIYGGSGAPVSPSVLTFAFKGVGNIAKSQVAQVGPARWEIRIVPKPGFTRADEMKLTKNIHALVDPDISLDVRLEDDIPATEAGKFRWVVNEMNLPK